MDRVRIVISYNGRWEQLVDGNQMYVGFDNQGLYVSKNMTFEELMARVHSIVKYDPNKYNIDLQSISIVLDTTCRTFIRNDDNVQLMLGEDRVIPQGALGHIDDCVFISNRHTRIEAGIASFFRYATYTICTWHFSENIRKHFHRKDVAQIIFAATKSYQELKYNQLMEELCNLHQNAYDYIVNAGPEKWSRVHCPQRRYRLMTTNSTECLNSCLRFARKLPMLTLAEFIRDMLQRWERNLDYTSQCADYYKRETLVDAYSVPIMPVGHPNTWEVSEDIKQSVVLPPQ
ncbi:hypothetical protein Dsin_018229 [Dipteronia sinensis]|uniref:MULE transposase domain-containing protein n=1 Tax=Dipteronia sinensis TaxID=43782 RepID=A0AAE0A6E0_9ROSI|nr:hypothetical protein Dsin_018229 [Dipteronia sinensis]